jgi:hypothetical protein
MLTEWMAKQADDDLFISFSLAEIYRGILERPSGKKRGKLEAWFHSSEGPKRCSTVAYCTSTTPPP